MEYILIFLHIRQAEIHTYEKRDRRGLFCQGNKLFHVQINLQARIKQNVLKIILKNGLILLIK